MGTQLRGVSPRVTRALARLAIKVEDVQSGELWALCPYRGHKDTNPSWSICAKKGDRLGLSRCKSCGFSGNLESLVAYVMGYDKEWDGGAQSVADWFAGDEEVESPEKLRTSFEVVSEVGARRGFELPEEVSFGDPADWPTAPREYLAARGIPEAQALLWGMGYASEGRLSGRIVIVVRDHFLAPASYMARSFAGAGKKYLYPMREEKPDMDVMFGEERWGAQRRVYVAEGALKALALERVTGMAVGALGTNAIRPLHALKLARFEHVVFVRDGGRPGLDAWQSVRASLGRHARLVCVELPEGEDSDSLFMRDRGELERRLRAASSELESQ